MPQARDAPRYAALEERVYEAFQPKDIIEEIWASDFVALEWEILSLRAVKVHLARSSMRAGLSKFVRPHFGWKEREELLNGWVRHDPGARDQVQRHLQALGLDERSIIAQTVVAICASLKLSKIKSRAPRCVAIRRFANSTGIARSSLMACGLRAKLSQQDCGVSRMRRRHESVSGSHRYPRERAPQYRTEDGARKDAFRQELATARPFCARLLRS